MTEQPVLQPSEGGTRSAAYFRERGLTRLVAELERAFYRNGRPVGLAVLADASEGEHDALAGLTGRKSARGPLRVRLADLDRCLRSSGFGCSLEELLAAWSGAPLKTRAAERATAESERARRCEGWREMLEGVAAQYPPESLAGRWLDSGAHGLPWLLSRFERLNLFSLDEKRVQLRLVADALDRLPLPEPRRLAVFANELAGDPHTFDFGTEAGRLLTTALVDLFGLDLFGKELGLASPRAKRLSAGARRQLYERVGVFPEGVSSTVAVYGLAEATRCDGEPDMLLAGSRPDVLVLPLRRLLGWKRASPGGPEVYVVENPTVFEDLVDALDGAIARGEHPPVVVCTAGWPSLAAWRLLDLLVAGRPNCVLHYSGDFDLGGLRIAAAVRGRQAERFRPWRMDPESYHTALRGESGAMSEGELRQLAALRSALPQLVEAMLATGRSAYQEAIESFLIGDLLA